MRIFFLLIFFFSVTLINAQEFTVTTGKDAIVNTPVYVTLKQPLSKGSYMVTNTKTLRSVPAQLYDDLTLVFIAPEELPAYTTTSFKIRKAPKLPESVTVKKDKRGLEVMVGNNPVFNYHIAVVKPPADSPDYYKRSGFIHPLYTPDGKVLTDDFPAGHAHQHGIFMTWVNCTFKGKFLDFWNQHKKTGTVEHAEVLEVTEGPVFAKIRTKLNHVSLTDGKVLEEIWTLTVYNAGKNFLFDLESDQQNITNDTLFLNKYTYGGLAFRGTKEWNRHDAKNFKSNWQILTSEGKDTSNANHTHATWVSASGVQGGAVVFTHPSNFRYPQAIRVHPDMPYWCYAPVVDGPFFIAPGAHYHSKYRFFVWSDGKPYPYEFNKFASNYAQPPTVTVN